jgi:hypothetical protein
LRGRDDDQSDGAAAGDQVAQQGDELLLLGSVADGGRVVGDLVDRAQDRG